MWLWLAAFTALFLVLVIRADEAEGQVPEPMPDPAFYSKRADSYLLSWAYALGTLDARIEQAGLQDQQENLHAAWSEGISLGKTLMICSLQAKTDEECKSILEQVADAWVEENPRRHTSMSSGSWNREDPAGPCSSMRKRTAWTRPTKSRSGTWIP